MIYTIYDEQNMVIWNISNEHFERKICQDINQLALTCDFNAVGLFWEVENQNYPEEMFDNF